MHTSSSIFEPSIAENREPPLASIVSPGLWATHAIRASDLQAKAFEPLRYVLPGLIPEGASLLVGRPKLGKSWLALDLCIAIADERTTLGALQPATGDVLYLALEDGERRLQRRMATLLPNANGWPTRLTLATRWKRANEGGLADIRDWCKWVEKPTAVVIDTLEKFRGLPGGRGFGQSRITRPSCNCKRSPPSVAWRSSSSTIRAGRALTIPSTRLPGRPASPAPPTRS